MTVVMGILNVTPDSFSDGGRWRNPDAAIAHGVRLAAEGATIVDVGGESTRPGAERPSAAEEARRILPVVAGLAAAGVPVGVDTMRADVAAAAVAAGAGVVNDVSGGLADPEMLAAVAESGAAYVTMHWRGQSLGMYERASYADVVAEVRAELSERISAALSAGIAADKLRIDPGFGFAKQPEHNWTLLAGLDQIIDLGYPVLVGVSRKGFLGRPGRDESPTNRDAASLAVTALVTTLGVWAVRTHLVEPHVQAIAAVERLVSAGWQWADWGPRERIVRGG